MSFLYGLYYLYAKIGGGKDWGWGYTYTMLASTSAGIVIYYGLLQLVVWWFCHVVSLFWGIQFPFHARSFKEADRVKYIHIVMVIMGLVLPTLPVIVAFTAGTPNSRGFGLTRFPPILCTSLEADATFYSLVLPINIALAIGVPLVIIIFWTIHKVHVNLSNTFPIALVLYSHVLVQ